MTLNLDHTASNGIPRPCRGCRHYFGQAHRGNHLNCGMHPHGPESDPCPDHEQLTDEWEALPNDAVVRRAMAKRMVDSLWRVVMDLNL